MTKATTELESRLEELKAVVASQSEISLACYSCEVCRDRDGGCPACRPMASFEVLLARAGVPGDIIADLSLPVHPQFEMAATAVVQAVKAGRSAVLTGSNGVGKTSAAMRGLRVAWETGKIWGFEMMAVLVRRIGATYKDGAAETVHDIMLELAELDVLVLDDLGAEKLTEAVCADLVAILSLRRGKTTVVTTNRLLEGKMVTVGRKQVWTDGLLEMYSSNLRSRLRGWCEVTVEGEDLRGV